MVKTYSPILHEFEAGAEVSQADVAVHIQQNVVRLNVPERRGKEKDEGVDKGRKRRKSQTEQAIPEEDEETETSIQLKQPTRHPKYAQSSSHILVNSNQISSN